MPEPTNPPSPTSPAEPVLFTAEPSSREPRNWTPLIVGFVLMLAVVAAIFIFGRSRPEKAQAADPYSPMLAVEQAKLSQADNFVGATVTYIDLTVHNQGSRTVTGGMVRAIFRDTLGQAVQTEMLPLRTLSPHSLGGDPEAADLALVPLGPGQTRVLRLTIEHVSSEWNQAQPDLEFRGLHLR